MMKLSNIASFWRDLDNVKSLQIFQLCRYGGIILTNILLAKSYLGLSEIGVYETLMFLATGITFFWVSGFLKGMLSIYPGLNVAERKRFFFNVFLLFAGMSVLMSGVYFGFQRLVLGLLTDYTSLPLFNLLCLFILINTPTYLVEYIYLLTEQPRKIVGFGVLAFGAQFLAVVVPIYLGYGLDMSFNLLIVVACVKFVWLLFLLMEYSSFSVDWKLIKPYLILTLPLIANFFVVGGAEYIDGVIIHRFFDEEVFAVFRYGARELPLALALTGAFSSALIPSIAANLEAGVQEIKQKSRQLMHVLFSVSIVLMLLSPLLFPLVFSVDFKESALIFNIYLLLLISRVLFPQTILIGRQETRIILWISLLELIVNVVLSLIFVQYWGIAGVAVATVIAYLLDKVLLVVYTKRKFQIAVSSYLDLRLYGVYSLGLVASFCLSLVIY